MKNKLKQTLSLVLTLVMVIGMLPMNMLTAFAADTTIAPTLRLYVNGTQVTGIDGSIDGYTHSDPDAGWSYDTTTGVLTLTDATLTTDKSSVGGVLYWTGGSLTIELVGTNTLDGEGEYPIFFKGDTDDSTLTIKGSGSLIVDGGIYCEYSTGNGKINITETTVTTTEICGKGDVTITDSTVISDGAGWAAIYSTANVTITNSTVVAKSSADSGGYGIQGIGTLSISNSQIEIVGKNSDIANNFDSEVFTNSVITTSEGTTVYGDAVLTSDLTIAEGQTLTIPEGASLTVSEGVTLTNNGTLNNSGTLTCVKHNIVDGTCSNCGFMVDLSGATVTLNPESGTYNGSAYTPSVSVALNKNTLVEGTDYTVSWDKSGFTNADTYTATITGKGIYTGSATKTFTITNADFASGDITVNGYVNTYDGVAHGITVNAPAGATVKYGTVAGTYDLTESPAYKNVGTYTVYYQVTKDNYNTVTGFGAVTIKTKEVSTSWGPTEFMPYTGQLVLPTASATGLVDGDTCELIVSVKETVDGAGVQPGEWTAKITGVSNGNYKLSESSLLEVKYTIYAQQKTPNVSAIDETIYGKNDGYISGLTTEMEYATKENALDDEYTNITNTDMIFAPGTYYVRFKAKSYHYSSPYKKVVVGQGDMLKVSIPATQIGYTLTTTATELAWNGSATISFALADEYSKTDNFVVKVNGTPVTLVDNQYVISNAQENITVTVDGVADVTAPTGEIKIKENSWKTFLNIISFGLFFNENQDVAISGTDAGSGLDKIYYYISSTALNKTQAEAISDWRVYNGLYINIENQYVIYAKITDKAGNCTIISSNGLVIDKTAPAVTGVENGKTYCANVEVTVDDTNLDKVTLNGLAVTLTDGKFTVAPADGTQTIVVTDKAGNSATYAITVNNGHTDSNKDHACDFGCSGSIGTCEDKNTDHKCDYGCTKIYGTHEQATGKHTCDYCGAKMSDCSGGTATCTEKAICSVCGAEYGEMLKHTPKVINSKEATTSEKGYTGDVVCEICGYEIAKGYDIPVKATPTEPDDNKPTSPETGDNSNMALWLSLLIVFALGLVGATVLGKKRKVQK